MYLQPNISYRLFKYYIFNITYVFDALFKFFLSKNY